LACVFCDSQEETSDHCFFKCHVVEQIWRKIWAWWGIDSPRSISITSLSNLVQDPTKKGFFNQVFNSVCGVACGRFGDGGTILRLPRSNKE